MKNVFGALIVVLSVTSISHASPQDYDVIYKTFATSGLITSFPLLPLFTTTDIAVDGKFDMSDDLLRKEILASQDEIAFYVTSDGEETAQMTNLLSRVRHFLGNKFEGSDMDLALGLLAVQ